MRNRKIKNRHLLFRSINGLIFLLLLLICVYPFYYVFIYSISDPNLAVRGVTLLPRGFSLVNYETIFGMNDIGNAFLVSVARTVLGCAITVVCCTFFSYLMTNRYIWGKRIIYRFVIFTMYVSGGTIPWYLLMVQLHLQNNFLLYIIPSALSAYYVILIKTYLESLPESLIEAAEVEGAGLLKIFQRIVLPLCKPILATIAVFAAVGQWNSYFDNLMLVTNPKLQTLQLVLYNYLNEAQRLANMVQMSGGAGQAAAHMTSSQSIQVTITIITTLPILFVYPLMQRHFVKGIMIGAVKG